MREAAELVLSHRMKSQPFSDQQMDKDRIEESIQKSQQEQEKTEEQEEQTEQDQKPQDNTTPDGSTTTQFAEGSPFKVNQKPSLAAPAD